MRSILILLAIISMNASAEIVSISSSEICVPETDDCESVLTINSNDTEITINHLMGPFYHSKVNEQVFDCGGNTLRRTLYANIFSENGERIKISHAGEIVDCGITYDGKYYWLAYEEVSDGNLKASIHLYNSLGEKVLQEQASFNSNKKFSYGGHQYSVYIPSVP